MFFAKALANSDQLCYNCFRVKIRTLLRKMDENGNSINGAVCATFDIAEYAANAFSDYVFILAEATMVALRGESGSTPRWPQVIRSDDCYDHRELRKESDSGRFAYLLGGCTEFDRAGRVCVVRMAEGTNWRNRCTTDTVLWLRERSTLGMDTR
ncbi:MAG: hypothetical protein J1E60_02845 [Christensenellaceae bacterium]|nr:hypothetical protein [Christensenellaceae bacterium]